MLGVCPTCTGLWRKDTKENRSSLGLQRAALWLPEAVNSAIKPGQSGFWLQHPASPPVPRAKAVEILILPRLGPYRWAHRISPMWGCEPCCSEQEASLPAAHSLGLEQSRSIPYLCPAESTDLSQAGSGRSSEHPGWSCRGPQTPSPTPFKGMQ